MSGPKEENSTEEQIQELNDQLFHNRLIHKMLVQISKDPTVCATLRGKIHESIMQANVLQMSELQLSEGSYEKIFDLSDLQSPDFTCDEQNEIVNLVDERLLDHLKELQGASKSEKTENEITEKILFDARANLQKTMASYANNLLEFQKLLQEVHDFRQNVLPDICTNKEKESALQHRTNNAKLQLIDHKLQMQIMQENEVSLDAYRDLVKNIRAEQEQYEIEIKALKELQVKYKMADCQEFQQVLKEYTDYFNAIERLERMQKLMNK